MSNYIARFIVVVSFLFLMLPGISQAPPPGGGGGQPGGGNPPSSTGAPIDGGSTIFLLSVVAYGYKRLKEKKKIMD